MIPVYTIAGLGADQRMFERLRLPDGFQSVPLSWIQPAPDDSIEAYAAKLTEPIDAPRPILLGVSFGGLMAVELSRIVCAPLTIIVSSMKTHTEIPWYFRMAGRLRLHRLTPGGRTGLVRPVAHSFIGASTDDAKQLLDSMVADSDIVFGRWAVDRLLFWRGCRPYGKLCHIHGTADRLLPYRFVNADITIEGGTHLMIYTSADRVNNAIARILAASGS